MFINLYVTKAVPQI